MTTEMSDLPTSQPAPETPWFEQTPNDWSSYVALRERVNVTRRDRENFRDWLAKSQPEGSSARALGLLAAGDAARALDGLSTDDGQLGKLLRAEALVQLGRAHEAVSALGELMGSDEAGRHAARLLLEVSQLTGDHDAATRAADALGKAGGADASYAEGVMADLAGEHATAIEKLHAAVEADSSHATATFALARLLDRFGDDDEASDLYSRFLDGTLPPHVGAIMNLGLLHEDAEDHRSAQQCFQLVLDADPTNKRARAYLRDAHASLVQFYDESRERKADKQNAVLRIPVTDFELSVRARNCLQRMNIHSLGDLVQRTESELLAFKNFGETSLQEVKDILVMKGLRLGMLPTSEGEVEVPAPVSPEGDVSQVKVSELDLSVRSRAALAMLGIATLGELAQTTETTLLSCKNFGQTSLDEIRSKLRQYSLDLPE